jgi:antitoxin (DNA-binding transcriptional repressor) of toxin-antitoxin stability system
MPMTIEVTDLPGRLKELLKIMETGTEVLLRDGDATAKLTTARPTRESHEPRIANLHPGIIMSDDFNDPLPDEFWDSPIESTFNE